MVKKSYGGLPPLPKPYKFVDLPTKKISRRHPAGHENYKVDKVRGTLKGVITVLSPVHVGSGQLELTSRKDIPFVKAHVRSGERPVIPGSSLKGAIRSIVEAISPSCVNKRITRSKRKFRIYKETIIPDNLRECTVDLKRQKTDICVACRMFGAMGYMGQVRFTDAVLREGQDTTIIEIPQLFEPGRDDVARNRYYIDGRVEHGRVVKKGSKVKGRKFYQHGRLAKGDMPVEVCPVDSKLDFTVHFDNLTEGELGWLLIALGQGKPKLYPKLGGGKPACCGSVEIAISDLRIVEDMKQAYTDYDLVTAPADVGKYLAAAQAEAVLFSDQLRRLAEILKLDKERQCPDRNY